MITIKCKKCLEEKRELDVSLVEVTINSWHIDNLKLRSKLCRECQEDLESHIRLWMDKN